MHDASRGLVLFILLIGLGGCQTRLRTACLSPEAQALAGARAAPAVEARHGGVLRVPSVERRLQMIGRRLVNHNRALDGSYHYRLLRTSDPNASSLPGGRIYLTRGLYNRLGDDQQIAAVIAHELAHLAAEDHFRPRCSSSAQAIEREERADRQAAAYLDAAGYDPQVMIDVVRLIADVQPAGWADCRVQSLQATLHPTDKSLAVARH